MCLLENRERSEGIAVSLTDHQDLDFINCCLRIWFEFQLYSLIVLVDCILHTFLSVNRAQLMFAENYIE